MRRLTALLTLTLTLTPLVFVACDTGATADWTGSWTGTIVLAFSYDGEGGSCTRGDLSALDEPEELAADDLALELAQEGGDVSGTLTPFVNLGSGGCALPAVERALDELAADTPLVNATAGVEISVDADASGNTLEWGALELEQTDDSEGATGRIDFAEADEAFEGGLVVQIRRQSPPEGEEGRPAAE